MQNFGEWHKHYCEDKIVDLQKYFSIEDFSVFTKLGLNFSYELMTAREYEIFTSELYEYNLEAYPKDYIDCDECEIEGMKSLKEKNVSVEEYKKIAKITEEMNAKFLTY